MFQIDALMLLEIVTVKTDTLNGTNATMVLTKVG